MATPGAGGNVQVNVLVAAQDRHAAELGVFIDIARRQLRMQRRPCRVGQLQAIAVQVMAGRDAKLHPAPCSLPSAPATSCGAKACCGLRGTNALVSAAKCPERSGGYWVGWNALLGAHSFKE